MVLEGRKMGDDDGTVLRRGRFRGSIRVRKHLIPLRPRAVCFLVVLKKGKKFSLIEGSASSARSAAAQSDQAGERARRPDFAVYVLFARCRGRAAKGGMRCPKITVNDIHDENYEQRGAGEALLLIPIWPGTIWPVATRKSSFFSGAGASPMIGLISHWDGDFLGIVGATAGIRLWRVQGGQPRDAAISSCVRARSFGKRFGPGSRQI